MVNIAIVLSDLIYTKSNIIISVKCEHSLQSANKGILSYMTYWLSLAVPNINSHCYLFMSFDSC